MGSEKKCVCVVMTFDDDSAQIISGEQATRWDEQVTGLCVKASIHSAFNSDCSWLSWEKFNIKELGEKIYEWFNSHNNNVVGVIENLPTKK